MDVSFTKVTPKGSFPLGQVVATPGALAALTACGLSGLPYLQRHASTDWGEVDSMDKRLNDDATENGGRLLSRYTLPNGEIIWIITEAADEQGNRVATTILLPEEY